MNADVEPEPENENHSYAMEYEMDGDAGLAATNDLSVEDRVAIAACKGLRRATPIIQELRPSTSVRYEYSYHPMENISQFWAGPSYWKFHKNRPTVNNIGNASDGSVAVNKRAPRRRNLKPKKFIKFTANNNNDDEDQDSPFDPAIFVNITSKEGQRLKKSNLYKRWDSKKLKLPTDCRLDRDMFDKYTYAPGYKMEGIGARIATQDDERSSFGNAEIDAFGVSKSKSRI